MRRLIINAAPNVAAIAMMWIDWIVEVIQELWLIMALGGVVASQTARSASGVVLSHAPNATSNGPIKGID